MSVIEVNSASAPTALVLGSPTVLVTETVPGVYQLALDTNNLGNGDILIVRSKIKIVSGGASRTLEEMTIAGITATKIVLTEPIPIAWEVVYELEQSAGTGRIVPWSVLRS